jgi:hypothetical protein
MVMGLINPGKGSTKGITKPSINHCWFDSNRPG